MRSLSFVAAAGTLAAIAAAQTVQPSNLTGDYETSGARYNLSPPPSSALSGSPAQLLPLTQQLSPGSFQMAGSLVAMNAHNADSVNDNTVAVVSCDESDYSSGNMNATSVLQTAFSNSSPPGAIVLYSVYTSHCNYTAGQASYPYIFTLRGIDSGRAVSSTLKSSNSTSSNGSGMNVTIKAERDTIPNKSNDDESSSNNTRNNVAMIILYSITGIIAVLFLTVIITGAVRAHRHPERYGPRNVVGRPRQSRAKGLARAMLETIPVVKFGDGDLEATPKPDVEMASNEGHGDGPVSEATAKEVAHIDNTPTAQESDDNDVSGNVGQPESATAPTTASATTPPVPPTVPPVDNDAPVCPICTDEFVKGQDVRVLPCDHKFHPECVDPWLVNVSGTCPLCRVNLNPEDDGTDTAAEYRRGRSRNHTSHSHHRHHHHHRRHHHGHHRHSHAQRNHSRGRSHGNFQHQRMSMLSRSSGSVVSSSWPSTSPLGSAISSVSPSPAPPSNRGSPALDHGGGNNASNIMMSMLHSARQHLSPSTTTSTAEERVAFLRRLRGLRFGQGQSQVHPPGIGQPQGPALSVELERMPEEVPPQASQQQQQIQEPQAQEPQPVSDPRGATGEHSTEVPPQPQPRTADAGVEDDANAAVGRSRNWLRGMFRR